MVRKYLLSAAMLLGVFSDSAFAETTFAIGEPAEGSVKTGIGQISGWAVSDVGIESIEVLIDGESLGFAPYGGTRQDVGNAFPDIPNSEFSGWALKWSFSLHEPGEHLLEVIVTDVNGQVDQKEVWFNTSRFNNLFISDPTTVKTEGRQVEMPQDGVIVIREAVIDGEIVDLNLKWDTASQQFLINHIDYGDAPPVQTNKAPDVDAGDNQVVKNGDRVQLEGSGSDPDGTITSWQWEQISGPSVSLENANQRIVQFVAPEDEGSVKLRLTAADDEGATDTDDVTVTVEVEQTQTNAAPKANAGPNLDVLPGATVVIEGQANDSDGEIASVEWVQTQGSPVSLSGADTLTVSFTAPSNEDEIRLLLKVRDNDGAEDSDQVSIDVAPPPNEEPSANAGSNFTVMAGDTVDVTGSGSDPDGEIVEWNWSQVSGLSVSLMGADSSTVRFTAPDDNGQVRLRLTVTDDRGATDSDDVIITVEKHVNQAPSANAGSNQTVMAGEEVFVSGSGSDSDGSIDNWSWSQVSGPSVALAGANSQHVSFIAPNSAGEVRLRLTVTDNEGAQDSDDVIITVEEEAEPPQTGDATGETLRSMLDMLNDARGQNRTCGEDNYSAQPPFQWSNSLAEIAMIHSMDMAEKGYFSHTSQDGTSMGDRVFPYWSGVRVGENIAASSANRELDYVLQLWLDSPGHCALIMNPDFSHVGIGAGHDEDNDYKYHHFWTMNFGG